MEPHSPKTEPAPRNARYLVGALAVAVVLTAAGLAVCLAWFLGRPDIAQVLPASSMMRFNTAVAFTLSGAALLSAVRDARRVAAAASAMVTLIGALSVLEYLTGTSLGIDQLMIRNSTGPFATLSGQMAPNTAVTFVAAGLGLLMLSLRWKAWSAAVIATLAALVVAMGLIALFGYAVNLVPAYEWGGFTQMAFLTAALFTLLGCGLILAAHGFSGARSWQDLPWLPSSAGIGLAALTVLGWNALRSSAPADMPLAWTVLPDLLLGLGICLSALLAGFIAQARHLLLQAATLERVNRDLQQRSEEVHDLYDQAPCGYHSLDKDGVIVEINQTELQWLGYAREELVGKVRAVDLLTAPSRKVMEDKFLDFKKTGVLRDLDLDFVRKDGSVLPAMVSATAEFGSEGSFIKSRTTLFDVTERRKAERTRQFLSSVVQSSHDAIISKSLDGVVTSWNPAAERLFGYSAAEMLGQPIALIIPPELIQEEAQILGQVRAGKAVVIHDSRRRKKDGSLVDVALAVSPIIDGGRVVGAAKVAHDLTEQKRAQAALKRSEQQVEKILERLQTAVVVHGEDTRIRFVNPSAATLLGLSQDQLMGRAVIDPYWHFVREDLQRMPPDEYPVSLVMKSKMALSDYVVGISAAPDRPTRWVLVNAVPDLNAEGNIRQVVVSFIDISERKRLAQELELQANTDALTHLATRRHFLELAEREFARSRRHRHDLSVLLLDVDHFKSINDEHGHQGGDLALQKLAQVITSTIRNVDLAGRLGGEEFCVLFPETDIDRAMEVAERLRRAVAAAEVSLPDRGILHFTISVGVACVTSTDRDLLTTLDRADQAMYRAKRSGRNQVLASFGASAGH